MTAQLVEAGYRVVGFDVSAEATSAAQEVGVETVDSYADLAAALGEERLVWLMIPSEYVDTTLNELAPHLAAGDTIVDGGNSFYQDSLERYKFLQERELRFLDCGTSGGVSGARHGASLMVGGDAELFATHEHVFAALAAPNAYARVGDAGAGHFVKMVHNGIEYGMMAAIAEGVNILHEHGDQFGIDIQQVFRPYEHESIISSKLVTCLRQAYEDGLIERISGEVPPGETEKEMRHITTFGDTQVLCAALDQRESSRTCETYVGKLIAAMRNQFGGHAVIEKQSD